MTELSNIKIGLSILPPFIMKRGEKLVGFEIDLWEKVANEIGATYSYISMPFKELLPALENKKIDMAMAGLTLTEEREEIVDFSHGTFDSGLHILVPSKARVRFFGAFRSIFTKELRNIFIILIGFVLISAHLVWFMERNGPGTLSGSYIPGIFNAIWWALTTLSTVGYGDYVPVTIVGRLVAMLIILSGMAIFGLYIGQISSAITIKRLRSDVATPEDLAGKKVATVAHTASEQTLRKLNASIVPVAEIEEAYTKLDTGEVDAVVFDAPVLLYYAHNEGKGKATVVGGLFARQSYGFALQQGSPLTEEINRAVLKFYDNGEYAALYKKWFGEEY